MAVANVYSKQLLLKLHVSKNRENSNGCVNLNRRDSAHPVYSWVDTMALIKTWNIEMKPCDGITLSFRHIISWRNLTMNHLHIS